MQNLSYPLNVEGDEQQGHYIMFTINETTPGMVATDSDGHAVEEFDAISSEEGPRSDDLFGSYNSNKKFIDSNLNAGSGKYTTTLAGAVGGSGLYELRPSTTRMAQAITLYMPPSVKASYRSNYKDEEIGQLASTALNAGSAAIKAWSQGGMRPGGGGPQGQGATPSMMDQLIAFGRGGAPDLAEGTATLAAANAMALIDTVAPGAAALAQISVGAIIGSKMELLFTNVGRRSFSFSFNFIPKSETEAKMVYRIVQAFKEHMLPEYASSINLKGVGSLKVGGGRILKIPDTFDIYYFYHNNENPFLNRISSCYLTSLDIDYGGDKYIAYDESEIGGGSGTPPQRTAITLNFTEIETITRERAQQGF